MKWRNGILGMLGILFAVLLFAGQGAVSAQDYECGTYSAGDYSRECETAAPSEPGITGTETTTGTVDESEPTIVEGDGSNEESRIVLNDFALYKSTTGKAVNMTINQVVYFTVGSNEYSITLKFISAEYITITISPPSNDLRVNYGETVNYDATGDGVADIGISYMKTENGVVTLNFKQLADVTGSEDDSEVSSPQHDMNWLIWLAVAGLGLTALICVIVVRRRSVHNNT